MLLNVFLLLVGFVLLVKGADFFVDGSSSVAKMLGIPGFVIGLTIVAMGTSAPEAAVSISAGIAGSNEIALSNVVGSNIFNVLGILGLTALLFPVTIGRKEMKFEIPLCIGVSLLLMILALNFFNGTPAVISRTDGIVLLLIFAGFMWYSFARDRKASAEQEGNTEESTPLWLAVVKIAGGLALLITSCDFFVDNAVLIAKSFGVNDAFISLTLIACGTSLPELAASLAAAVKKNTALALGNIVGSNIFNITLILGLSSQVMPLNSTGITAVDYAVMIAAALATLLFGLKGKIGRVGGAMMFLCFVAYNWYLISNQIV